MSRQWSIQPVQQQREFFKRFFDMADRGKKGFVDVREDMKNTQVQYLKGFFEMCDRDGDGRVSKKEFDDGLQLNTEAYGTTFTLTVNETSRGLFELLDINRTTLYKKMKAYGLEEYGRTG